MQITDSVFFYTDIHVFINRLCRRCWLLRRKRDNVSYMKHFATRTLANNKTTIIFSL